jgi:hypothetical protein
MLGGGRGGVDEQIAGSERLGPRARLDAVTVSDRWSVEMAVIESMALWSSKFPL